MSVRGVAFTDVESCVEATLTRIGRRICLGAPLGLGKANHIVNEFFRRAQEDPRIELRICESDPWRQQYHESDRGALSVHGNPRLVESIA